MRCGRNKILVDLALNAGVNANPARIIEELTGMAGDNPLNKYIAAPNRGKYVPHLQRLMLLRYHIAMPVFDKTRISKLRSCFVGQSLSQSEVA
jgi:hypothetical protein